MSTEENKAIVHRVYSEVINAGNLDRADAFIAVNMIEHEEFPGIGPGLAGFKQVIGMFRAAFPDMTFTAEDTIAEGDHVVARFTMRGTHRGELMGIPATGKSVKINGIDIARISGGKISEHWGQMDTMGLMQQLGAIPTPG